MRFSQRIGITPAEKIVQIDSMDDDLRNSLWNALTISYWDKFDRDKFSFESRVDYVAQSNLYSLIKSLWISSFKKPIDTIPTFFYDRGSRLGALAEIRNFFFVAEGYDVFNIIEDISNYGHPSLKKSFINLCNQFLEKENSAYRFVDGKIIEINSSQEIEEIENAIFKSTPYQGTKQHLQVAITLLSDKENPDYRNSIKESISAVESLCKTVTNKTNGTLSGALDVLNNTTKLHPALKDAFKKLYGYTSDADGIRHPSVPMRVRHLPLYKLM